MRGEGEMPPTLAGPSITVSLENRVLSPEQDFSDWTKEFISQER
jgi:hypothetical protein